MTTTCPPSPVPFPDRVDVQPGPALLAGIEHGPSLAAHRRQYGEPPAVSSEELHEALRRIALRGRGGAGFPFATKLEAVLQQGSRPVLVVNMSEGEPASSKDTAIALTRPHLVLDGVVTTARSLRAREVHLVLPGERPAAAAAMRTALEERSDGVRIRTHVAAPRFVSGQAKAVVELLSGRPNLPVTSWQPEAVSGHKGRPTLLSNAETWARVGLLVLRGVSSFCSLGTREEPGTTLLTLSAPGHDPVVREAEYGARLRAHLLPALAGRPALVGGFHGSWTTWETLASARTSVPGMRALGAPLGAGVVLSAPHGTCPVTLTGEIVAFLAGQSAGRCGPCLNGLPALARAVSSVVDGTDGPARVEQLAALVERRGACAHPDGTVRLVRSMLATFPEEVGLHARSGCSEHRRLHVVPDRPDAPAVRRAS
ncbi:NADH-ubiquinone oxidoreductase-F iron-sulfur binding region domain-containing protein [Nocardioides halotolerans]|jgi:NADH:ubiquinone oxidoreductase subunit F (NADH-binding)|uniref:NADH-ubiquinone oxidoreductase-F iron-sulfur binding region domain-containing protein n=1 Tax=Nocardioides halotolerans TaxID=433660 RepID=UPI0003F8EC23|nr:NADH-ubiquinone oxidoreductase-F iron-sulfur binding region domain-containing protein [Nocardioides halotolerans]